MSLKTIVNGIDVRRRAAAGAASAPAQLLTSTEWLGGTQTRTLVASPTHRRSLHEFAIETDYPDEQAGFGMALSPLELLVTALASSFVTSFVISAALADVRIESARVRAAARLPEPQAAASDRAGPECHFELEVDGTASLDTLETLIAAALERCPVAALTNFNVHAHVLRSDAAATTNGTTTRAKGGHR